LAQVQALTAAAADAPADVGQLLPGEAAGAPPPPAPGGAQLSAETLASLLDAQQADAGGGAKAQPAHQHHRHHRHAAGGAEPAEGETTVGASAAPKTSGLAG
jgi:hypothetical protein